LTQGRILMNKTCAEQAIHNYKNFKTRSEGNPKRFFRKRNKFMHETN